MRSSFNHGSRLAPGPYVRDIYLKSIRNSEVSIQVQVVNNCILIIFSIAIDKPHGLGDLERKKNRCIAMWPSPVAWITGTEFRHRWC